MERSLRRCVVFDLGGVLTGPEGPVAELAAALDVTVEQLAVPYWRHRDGYDRGGSAVGYWDLIRRELADVGLLHHDVATDWLDRVDAERWATVTSGAEELLADLDAAGHLTTVLSNAPASLAAVVRAAPWSTRFSSMLFSSDVALMKPEAAIYRLVEQGAGVPRHELLFFDDRPSNVEAARRRGWSAHLWAGTDAARRVIAGVGSLDG